MKRCLMTLTVLGIALAAAPSSGSTFIDRLYGTPEPIHAPRARALGGAGVALANGVYDLVDNPAMLATAKGRKVQLAAAIARASENRFVPLFDTFDSFVDESAIAVNDETYSSWNGGFVLDQVGVEGLVVAAGIFDRYDPRYDYADERRSTATTDQIVSQRFIRSDGYLQTASLGGGYALPNNVSIGAALNYYFGDLADRDALVPRLATVTATSSTLERNLTGFSITIGGAYKFDERLNLGLAFETRPQLDNDFTATVDGSVTTPAAASNELELPYRIQAGAAFHPRNTFRTTFVADLIYMPWSEVDDPLFAGRKLEDTWDVRFGLEHVYYNKLPGRIGFRYASAYADREADRATFTFGLGYLVDAFRLDVSGEIGKRTSRQTPVFPREEQGPAVGAGLDRVEDTLVRLTLGAEVDF